jgi:hypothetical protein
VGSPLTSEVKDVSVHHYTDQLYPVLPHPLPYSYLFKDMALSKQGMYKNDNKIYGSFLLYSVFTTTFPLFFL